MMFCKKEEEKKSLVGMIVGIAAAVAAVAGAIIVVKVLLDKFREKTCFCCEEDDCDDCGFNNIEDENLNCVCDNEGSCNTSDEKVDLDSEVDTEKAD